MLSVSAVFSITATSSFSGTGSSTCSFKAGCENFAFFVLRGSGSFCIVSSTAIGSEISDLLFSTVDSTVFSAFGLRPFVVFFSTIGSCSAETVTATIVSVSVFLTGVLDFAALVVDFFFFAAFVSA